jgi:hypothetical protein
VCACGWERVCVHVGVWAYERVDVYVHVGVSVCVFYTC